MLMIDTRMKINSGGNDFSDDFDDCDEHPLEKAIQSKYVSWNQTQSKTHNTQESIKEKPTKFWTMSKLQVGRVFLSHTFSKKKVWSKTFEVGRSNMDVHTNTKVW